RGEFVVPHGAFDRVIPAEPGREGAVLPAQEIELRVLLRGRIGRDDVFNRRALRTDNGGLMIRGQEAAAERLHATDRHMTEAEHDIAGEVFVLAAEAITHPRTETG